MILYMVHHVNRPDTEDEDEKLIGIYSTKQKAEEAVKRLSEQPGFSESPENFDIGEIGIDEDYWTEGFVTVHHD